MEFLRSVVPFHPAPIIAGEKVILRAPTMADYPAWSSLREESRNFLMPWEPIWPSDDLTRPAYRRRLRRYQREMHEATGYPFLVFKAEGLTLVGGLTLSHIVRGVTQSCSLGYWMGAPYAGQGLMGAAVKAIMPFVFETLRLHRLEAACLPHNAASIRLLEKAGFTREGYARRYLCIEGRWQDHLLFAIVSDDPRP
ncbi:GNAT family protein [Kaistia dalseonensis]|nr:GNAT family protein [Kaistia dalseonensis]MCX5497455.1 GNAT family protein [Kaistia dalseonensis]